jgi:Rab-GTPase-TBC domain
MQEKVAPDSKYATLLQVTVGQEEVEDIIRRDIHRTFPQHPQFLLGQGQEELFNVLKAYSLTDMEVGYCQGMAFVAGILLMYMPEHLAFQLFCTLMSRDGPNLRRFYLDGLSDLKHEMAMFEWLLARHHPRLAGHLQQHCIPCVLYVSQWLLTVFACPFPAFFTAQLIDIMLLENSDRIIMQVRHERLPALHLISQQRASVLHQKMFASNSTIWWHADLHGHHGGGGGEAAENRQLRGHHHMPKVRSSTVVR